ncbi:myosin IC heavy chain-like [Panicum virgatum]|nr:myosin IC heavy chain-like [Panicum virgatum]
MPVLGRAGQPRSHRGRRPSPPPSPWRSSPPGSGKGEARSTGSAGRAASWSGVSSPPGSGEGAARSTGGAGRAASWSGGSSPPDPARAAAGRAAGAAAAGPAWHPHLSFRCRKDGHAAMLKKEELLVPISLAISLRELRRMY